MSKSKSKSPAADPKRRPHRSPPAREEFVVITPPPPGRSSQSATAEGAPVAGRRSQSGEVWAGGARPQPPQGGPSAA
eukprot:9228823-Pyramimonas_sp.AAC.1